MGVAIHMNNGPVRVAMTGVVVCLLLGGCSSATPTGTGAPTAPGASAEDAAPSPGRTGPTGATGRGSDTGERHERGPDGDTDAGSDEGAPAPSGEDGSGPGSGGSGTRLEVPQAPEPTVTSLAELLGPATTSPLVTTPLPRAAAARGRLVARFPVVLRPTRAARVESSSLSPSGDRLQVGLVASTSMSPAEVLLAYRTRLARRGLVELSAPPTLPGSLAATFRRGGSVVTVTVTPDGSRTILSLQAILRPGRG